MRQWWWRRSSHKPPGQQRLQSPLATITLPCSGTDRPARTTDGTNDAKQKRSFHRGPLGSHKEGLEVWMMGPGDLCGVRYHKHVLFFLNYFLVNFFYYYYFALLRRIGAHFLWSPQYKAGEIKKKKGKYWNGGIVIDFSVVLRVPTWDQFSGGI